MPDVEEDEVEMVATGQAKFMKLPPSEKVGTVWPFGATVCLLVAAARSPEGPLPEPAGPLAPLPDFPVPPRPSPTEAPERPAGRPQVVAPERIARATRSVPNAVRSAR